MVAENLLRLAWEADHDGRRSLRDALLTLAITESGPEDDWRERCRTRLLAERPDHFLGRYPNVRQALEDPQVTAARDRLRIKYPADRVGWLLLRARVGRGTYTGRPESLDAMLEDLTGPRAEADNVRLDAPESVRGPLTRARTPRALAYSLVYPPMTGRDHPPESDPSRLLDPVGSTSVGQTPESRWHYYSVVFAIGMLLASLPEEPGAD